MKPARILSLAERVEIENREAIEEQRIAVAADHATQHKRLLVDHAQAISVSTKAQAEFEAAEAVYLAKRQAAQEAEHRLFGINLAISRAVLRCETFLASSAPIEVHELRDAIESKAVALRSRFHGGNATGSAVIEGVRRGLARLDEVRKEINAIAQQPVVDLALVAQLRAEIETL